MVHDMVKVTAPLVISRNPAAGQHMPGFKKESGYIKGPATISNHADSARNLSRKIVKSEL